MTKKETNQPDLYVLTITLSSSFKKGQPKMTSGDASRYRNQQVHTLSLSLDPNLVQGIAQSTVQFISYSRSFGYIMISSKSY